MIGVLLSSLLLSARFAPCFETPEQPVTTFGARDTVRVLEFPLYGKFTADEWNVRDLMYVDVNVEEGMARDKMIELSTKPGCMRGRRW
ncbi:hypothetical protein H0H87_004939, partial [Tephrocybe sp. NHM501043]